MALDPKMFDDAKGWVVYDDYPTLWAHAEFATYEEAEREAYLCGYKILDKKAYCWLELHASIPSDEYDDSGFPETYDDTY